MKALSRLLRMQKPDEHDTFEAGFHDLPSMGTLKRMSFSELAIKLQKYAAGSAAFLVVQREMKLKENPFIWSKPWFLWGTTAIIGIAGLALKYFG